MRNQGKIQHFDVVVVGAGIIGLALALAATRRGQRVAVIERHPRATGASIRNFGFVTVTGQQAGEQWARALRSRDVWQEIAPQAGIDVLHRGAVLVARRAEAADVLHEFLATPMGEGCRLINREEAARLAPALRLDTARAILHSPHELRVESSEALPKLAAWLEQARGVAFFWNTAVHEIDGHVVQTSRGAVRGEAVAVCPGDDFSTLFPERIASYGLRVCTLQMLRVAPGANTKFGVAILSDLSLARYEGFADLPAGRALGRRLDAEEPETRAAGVHLIAVQSADGSLVVGDSHVYGDAVAPFADTRVDDLILKEFDRIFDLPERQVARRWSGTYTSAIDRMILIDRPEAHIRLVMATGGTGASIGFALGEQVMEELA